LHDKYSSVLSMQKKKNFKDKLADQLLVGNLKEGNVAFVEEENDSISLKIRDSEKTIH